MFLTTVTSFWIAGIAMLVWLRIISSTDQGILSWPFVSIEKLVGDEYNRNVRFIVGILLWLIISIPFAVVYWILVEKSILTYYDTGSVILLSWFLYGFSMLVTFPIARYGIGARLLSKFVWLESLTSWIVFGFIFYMLIKIV